MTKIIFLGAGASAEAGLPLDPELTSWVETQVVNLDNQTSDVHPGETFKIIKTSLEKNREKTIFKSVGLEDIAATAEMLHEIEIGSVYDRQKSLRVLPNKGNYFPETSYSSLLSLIRHLVYIRIGSLSAKANYRPYLFPLVKSCLEKNFPIFTLNLDYVIEGACIHQKIPYSIGLTENECPSKIFWGKKTLKLCKLHGSTDWQQKIHPEQPHLRFSLGSKFSIPPDIGQTPDFWASYGNSHKYRHSPPFRQLFRFFENNLEKAKTIYAIGYSFKDPYINDYFYWWCSGNSERRIKIANGEGFSSKDLPRTEIANLSSPLLKNRADIFPWKASRAISEWFNPSSAG